ncbi:MAG: c-type cytochrome biogenesis protein CcmI [Nitrosomonadales bacterium]|nr:c-type cytochrome biogenesis protein CcmI [Nitrosomonadales bacterium]
MTTFWIISALLLIVAVLFVGVPLWRGIARNNAVVRDAANLEIYRDQIAEMDTDLRNGLLTPELHEQGKRELQARLLEEVHPDEQQDVPVKRNPYKTLAIALALLIPLASVGLYLQLGNLQAFSPLPAHGAMPGQTNAAESLKSLEERVAQSPADPEALLMLARTYSELGRFSDAARTYDSLTKIVPDEAWIWADYADALAMTHSTLMGAPTKLLEKALKLDPNNLKTLALSGTAAMERGDYAAAVRHWEKLLKLVPADNPDAQMIKDGVHQARQLLAQSKGGKAALEQINDAPAKAATGKERISGTVTLSDSLRSQVAPNDTVFVLARAAQGPKMPLAIVRKQVRDLPLQFSLDDSMAMSPEMRMSNFDRVVVVARVSKSGNAMPEPGDLQGMSKPLALGSRGIKVDIDQQVR